MFWWRYEQQTQNGEGRSLKHYRLKLGEGVEASGLKWGKLKFVMCWSQLTHPPPSPPPLSQTRSICLSGFQKSYTLGSSAERSAKTPRTRSATKAQTNRGEKGGLIEKNDGLVESNVGRGVLDREWMGEMGSMLDVESVCDWRVWPGSRQEMMVCFMRKKGGGGGGFSRNLMLLLVGSSILSEKDW